MWGRCSGVPCWYGWRLAATWLMWTACRVRLASRIATAASGTRRTTTLPTLPRRCASGTRFPSTYTATSTSTPGRAMNDSTMPSPTSLTAASLSSVPTERTSAPPWRSHRPLGGRFSDKTRPFVAVSDYSQCNISDTV